MEENKPPLRNPNEDRIAENQPPKKLEETQKQPEVLNGQPDNAREQPHSLERIPIDTEKVTQPNQKEEEEEEKKCCPVVPGKRPCWMHRLPIDLPLLPSPEVLGKLKLGYERLIGSKSKSLLRKYLSRNMLDTLKYKVTRQGSNLLDIAQSGFEHLDSEIGVYAADCDSYDVFVALFDPILADYHKFDIKHAQPPLDWGDPQSISLFKNIDPDGKIIKSTRVRCCRSIKGFPLSAKMMPEHYQKMERDLTRAFLTLDGVHSGKYETLAFMSPTRQNKLIEDHYLFKEGDKYLISSRACDHWPIGRGIFMNEDKTFMIWVGKEDHLCIISMQMGDNLGEVYQRMIDGVHKLEKELTFTRHPRFGYITFCPSNLGTSIQASALMYLPKFQKDVKGLQEIAEKHYLKVCASNGNHMSSLEALYVISNKRRLGLTEYEAVRETYTGMINIVKMELEKRLTAEGTLFRRKTRRGKKNSSSKK